MEWKNACLLGHVVKKLHPQSLFQKVVSTEQLQVRVNIINGVTPPNEASPAAAADPNEPQAFVVLVGRSPGVYEDRYVYTHARVLCTDLNMYPL